MTSDLSRAEKETVLEPFVLKDLLPSSLGSYYRYTGSLTTPPCSKVVEWIVFSRPIYVSYKQVRNRLSQLSQCKYDPETPPGVRLCHSLSNHTIRRAVPVGRGGPGALPLESGCPVNRSDDVINCPFWCGSRELNVVKCPLGAPF